MEAMVRRLRALAAVPLMALAGCGGDRAPVGDSESVISDAGAAHIHGVGINPADDSVFIATHSGMFRAAADEQRARRVGKLRQDTMGFTVIGPDRFLGSGHPDAREALPPLLGLIRSSDAGRSWQPISLLGQADFHVLRAAGRRVYGVNASDGALLVSSDGGQKWAQRTPPGAILDLAIDPAGDDRIVVSSDRGLFISPDGGRGWRPLHRELIGMLAWTEQVTLVDARGDVHTSADAGRDFERVGSVGGRPAALAAHEALLLAALHDNTVRVSSDGGRTWTLRVQAS